MGADPFDLKPFGTVAGQIPQLARDVGRSSIPKLDPMALQNAEAIARAIPRDWFLKTLAPTLKPFDLTLEVAYTTSGNNQIGTYEVPDGTSAVLFRYSFFAELPDVGGRFILARPNDFRNLITLNLTVGGTDPFRDGYTFAATARSGVSWLDDQPNRTLENLPLYLHGKTTLEARYTVITNPAWTVSYVGFAMWGFEISQTKLVKLMREADLL